MKKIIGKLAESKTVLLIIFLLICYTGYTSDTLNR